ncbi:hypothetical protein ACFFR2_36860, partial [Streptosporangium nondiastaticum]|uniref:hypothetical protein n=3 Tax=Streptosporangiaceae TaxID=2004 RepID=UPI0035EB388A
MRTLRSLAFTTVLGAALLANTTPASAEPPPDDSTSRFSIEALTKNTYSAPLRKPAHDQGFQVMRLGDGEAALVDSSLVSAGLATATKPEAVEISWVAQSNAQGYTIVRDNVKIADLGPGVDYYRDSKITPGATHQYIVTPTSLTKGTHPVWGMKITVPQTKAGEEKADTLGRYADIRSSAAAAEGETTVTWETFIPQAKVDAPPIGCEY